MSTSSESRPTENDGRMYDRRGVSTNLRIPFVSGSRSGSWSSRCTWVTASAGRRPLAKARARAALKS